MEFADLPDRPDDPRYARRAKDIARMLKAREGRVIEEGMLMDRFTAEEDFYWFLLRFTSYADPALRTPGSKNKGFRITERGHDLRGSLWIEHPFLFWYARELQRVLAEPPDGPVWVDMHRNSYKTTVLLLFACWLIARDEMETCGWWTHKVDKIGANMGRGALENIQGDAIADHWPQYRNLQQGTNLGFIVDRPVGPRDQTFSVFSILGSIVSIHPRRYFFDDIVTDALRGNVDQIAKISSKIGSVMASMPPDSTAIFANTPWDEADPLEQRKKDHWFGRVIEQWGTEGGQVLEKVNGRMRKVRDGFTPRGEPNLHTRKFFEDKRIAIKDDSIYFPQYEGQFFKSPTVLFDWSKIRIYEEDPVEIAKASPYVNIIVDGAGGGKGADFCAIRVITWTACDAWANLDLIRERVGQTMAMQLLLGRDETDSRSAWIPDLYRRYGKLGIVEYWMAIDPQLMIWFDDNTAAGWRAAFEEHMRLRRITFGGRSPQVKRWPEVHANRAANKEWLIRGLEGWYAQGKVAYPKPVRDGGQGFGHGSHFGLTGSEDVRDVLTQFIEDEFSRMELGKLPPFDDMLDTERLMTMDKANSQMRRPLPGGGFSFGEKTFPAPTIENPWGFRRPWFKREQGQTERGWMAW